jgi:molybdate transport system substrate-binding protein
MRQRFLRHRRGCLDRGRRRRAARDFEFGMRRPTRRLGSQTRILVYVGLCLLLPTAAAEAQSLTVFAAASLTEAMRAVDQAWTAQGHPRLLFSFAASSTLARQLDQGAPANIFASADEEWMDWAVKRQLIVEKSIRDVLTNKLVLVVPKDHAREIDIKLGFDLAALLGASGRLAVGDPAHVPAGRYAQQALTKLGLWDAVKNRLAPADSVRSALLLVERGEVPAGIVYLTDAMVSSQVAVAGTFPADSHERIAYPFAVTSHGDTSAARALMTFMTGPDGLKIFTRFGFKPE